MLKTIMMTTALTGALMSAAVAQSNMNPPANTNTPGMNAPAAAPNANAPAAAPMTSAPAAASDAKFINAQSTDQWLTSNFMGVDVVGPDNEKIGDVSDVLFEKNGNVVAYIVGVGGFLGIGAKNVALAPASFQVVPANEGTTGSAAANSPEDIKLKLNMTKDQLKQAASFESKRDLDSKSRTATQPRQGGMDRPATTPR